MLPSSPAATRCRAASRARSRPAFAPSRWTCQLRLQPGEREIVGQRLRTHEQFTLAAEIGLKDQRPEDYIVHALVDFDDIDYFTHADLLYDLAGQMVRHLQSYLSESEAVNVLNGQRKTIAKDPRSADGALLRGGDRV